MIALQLIIVLVMDLAIFLFFFFKWLNSSHTFRLFSVICFWHAVRYYVTSIHGDSWEMIWRPSWEALCQTFLSFRSVVRYNAGHENQTQSVTTLLSAERIAIHTCLPAKNTLLQIHILFESQHKPAIKRENKAVMLLCSLVKQPP